ncbi:MAG TPA: hypothetical protein EYN38_04065, partial [Flavobacteriales bacterium]|nr:hypothetical protein [Flavobacteriales bacterium]
MLFLVCSIACNEVRNVTYSEHIAQIIFENCSSCHRPHESGPFPLTNYKEVFKYAEMIKEVTQNRYMPPWSADPAYSHFLNEKRLTDQEIEQITRWVDRGAPLGDSSKIPEAPVFHNNSSIGKPDLVLKMTQPYVIPPDGEDKFKVFIFPIHIRKDTIVKAMEFVPGNKKLVHHVWYFEDTTNYFSTLDSLLPGYAFNFFEGNDYLPIPPEILVVYPELSELKTTSTKHLMDGGAGYIPGSSTQIYPPGIGRLLRANTTLLMQIHYSGTGLKSEDLSRLNLFFAREPIERHTQFILLEEDNITNSPFTIPAGEVKNFQSSQLITQDISILSIAPHMHYL